MKKLVKVLVIAGLMILPATKISAQIYHEECKEDLREFMRQGTNYEKLGLSEADTNSWITSEDWVPKVKGVSWYENWLEPEDPDLRIYEIHWGNLDLEGKIKFYTPILMDMYCNNNKLTEIDVSSNIHLDLLHCYYNNLTKLDVRNQVHLSYLSCSYNNLTELLVNKTGPSIGCSFNKLKLSTLPVFSFGCTFIYSPQDTIYGGIKEYLDTVDLSSEYKIDTDYWGTHFTIYKWFDITDGEEKEVEQPQNDSGVFYFAKQHAGKKMRCKMFNEVFSYSFLVDFNLNKDTFWLVYETDILVGIQDNYDAQQLYELENNVYLLKNAMQNVKLFNMSGQKVLECKDEVLDLTPLPIGVYILQYIENKQLKNIKLIRK
ncbi:MAG: T9SS type A sorting domain-containing protein [Bacteroidetes bacterium]|nr:T9SS type A sorting domain-containing protein [Bacteroidota bacterium]